MSTEADVKLLTSEQSVEVSDTTKFNSSNAAKYKIITQKFYQKVLIISAVSSSTFSRLSR